MIEQNSKNKIWIFSTVILAIVLVLTLIQGWDIKGLLTAFVGSIGQQEQEQEQEQEQALETQGSETKQEPEQKVEPEICPCYSPPAGQRGL